MIITSSSYLLFIRKATFLVCFFAFSSYCEEIDYFNLSLEELMDITVVTQKAEPVLLAPAVVSSINIDEVRGMGFRTLKDILSFLPGIEVNQSNFGNHIVQIRGLSDAFNQKVLFLLDGVPYWMSSNGDIPLLGIPIESIVKLEVIRGPGSVLYGTNASAGVINVITRQAKPLKKVFLSVGTQNKRSAGLYLNKSFKNSKVNVGLESFREDGYTAQAFNANNIVDFSCFCSKEDVDGDFERFENYDRALVNYSINGLNMTFQAHQAETSRAPDSTILNSGVYKQHGYMLASDYRFEHNNLNYKVFADWNRFYYSLQDNDINVLLGLDGDGEISFNNNGKNNTRYRLGIQTDFTFFNYFSLMGGFTHEDRSVEDYRYIRYDNPEFLEAFGFVLESDGSILLGQQNSATENALYSQLSFEYADWHTYVGGRQVDSSIYGSRFNPSAGIVRKLTENQSLKFLYSEGFNSPTFRQVEGIDTLGNDIQIKVEPEVITSVDLVYNYSTKPLHFVANIYKVKADKLIISDGGVFVNGEDISRHGFELDGQYRTNNFSVMSALAYLKEGNSDTRDISAKFSSKWLARVGARYQYFQHSFGGAILYGSKRAEATSYTSVNLSYQYSWKQWLTSAKLNHVLGSFHLTPDVRTNSKFLFEAQEKYVVELSLAYQF